MYSLELSNNASKELEHIYRGDHKQYSRLIESLESLRSEPFQGKRLKGQFQGDYSLRVGSYRIVYSVYRHKLVISVIDIGHRREIYR